ncbi:hypothetical protein BU24DRAFT_339413 [Aaosphaeria arxii CBS 175.79]|uniref:BZIP domain-containing protein n=1 Tax=Aaosphaeria arxii CBS 175.79 TaxID=1450172 RepID=A0A6A5YAS7_9PLEO|nr:uncharacterized protein BU24DRAFT_339413 [Aaosphaeria arxii CBS 175.79]KAF2022346.1 hypothetical protein BU24DRAFT_339413 [Aaosphaeria arxii CBS 175.79]
MASTSPSDTTSPTTNSTNNPEYETLERKRARDRKSQKAMRERTKWNIQCLNDQVAHLTQALEVSTREKSDLYNRFLAISEENDHLRVQKAALQLRLLGNGQNPPDADAAGATDKLAPYEAIPLNTSPTCLSDQILQTFVESRWEAYAWSTPGRVESYPDKPNLSALFDGRPNRVVDETSAVVGDIIRSYTEINTLPKQVAVHYVMSTFMKWQVLRTEQAYEQMPEWLRPIKLQLERPHPCWIDRIPWPKVRSYLIEHPEINFHDFASSYSTSFHIKWEYDPGSVIITMNDQSGGILINPIYEEHIRQMKNWTVRGSFRTKFLEMTEIIDSYGKSDRYAIALGAGRKND